MKRVVCLNDPSDHGGKIITTNNDGTLFVRNAPVAVQGAQHRCPIEDHGTTTVDAVITRSYHNNKLILTKGVVASCGAKILPPDRNVYINR